MTMAPPAAPSAPAASGGPRTGPARRRPGEFGTGRKFTPRRKVCQFCVDKIKEVDYKDLIRLRRFLSERGKIEPRRKTGTCAAHQRSLNVGLKRARQLALLPFTAEHIRVTGVLVREPGAPPFRGARPRPQELDGTPEAPADGTAVAAETPPDGQAAAAEPTPAEPAPSEPAPAEPTPAEPAVVAELATAESSGDVPLPVTQGQEA
jgi:small subunit ribosomal protein S18